MSYAEKDHIVAEVETIAELLSEATGRLAELPRTATAARQLNVIVNRLEGWKRTFGPTKHFPFRKGEKYPANQVDKMMKAYRKYGYFGLDDQQREILHWYADNYPQNAA